MNVYAAGCTDPGLVRDHNEDGFVLADLTTHARSVGEEVRWPVGAAGILLAVSDGMGGAKAGEVASALSLDALLEGLSVAVEHAGAPSGGVGREASRDGEDATARLRRIVEWASEQVRQAGQRPDRAGMGATLTAVYVHGPSAYIAQIGDSRAYLLRGGTIEQVTHDQSYVQTLVDTGVLDPEEAERSPYKNVLTQSMGQDRKLHVDTGHLRLEKGDRLLLCSDGLSNTVDAATMQELAGPGRDLTRACAELVARANEAGGPDNITVVLAEIHDP